MVIGRCLGCGGLGKAKESKNRGASVGVPVTFIGGVSASASASTSRVAVLASVSLPVVPKTAPPTQAPQQAAPSLPPAPPVLSDGEIFDKWYKKWSPCLVENHGWVPMSRALLALKESSGNAVKFLTGGESSKSQKVWEVGPFGTLPKRGTDWKKMESKAGGGSGHGQSYHVKKALLKRVVLERYRVRVLAQLS